MVKFIETKVKPAVALGFIAALFCSAMGYPEQVGNCVFVCGTLTALVAQI